MMISSEQARLAADHLRQCSTPHCGHGPYDVSDEVMRQAFEVASHAPDLRPERVMEARHRLQEGTPDAHDVAEKMLSRLVSDFLR